MYTLGRYQSTQKVLLVPQNAWRPSQRKKHELSTNYFFIYSFVMEVIIQFSFNFPLSITHLCNVLFPRKNLEDYFPPDEKRKVV